MSPEVVAVQVNALPAVTPDVGQLTALASAVPPTFAMVEPVPVAVLPSLAVLLTLNCPLDEQVTEIVLVVDVPVQPDARVHVNV